MSEARSIVAGANIDNIFSLTLRQVTEKLRSPTTRFSEAVMKYLAEHPEDAPDEGEGVPAVAAAVGRVRRAVSGGSFAGLDPRGLVNTFGANDFGEEDLWPCLAEERGCRKIAGKALDIWRIMSGFRIEESYVKVARAAGFSVVPASIEQDAVGIDCIVNCALFDVKSSRAGAVRGLAKKGKVPRVLFVPPLKYQDFGGNMLIHRKGYQAVIEERPVVDMTTRAVRRYWNEIAV